MGDHIVISASSVYGYEVDEAFINATSYNSATDTTTLTLSTPLTYTHLGEVVTVPGNDHILDMRAEVAVLNRNVVFEGEEASTTQYMFGAHIMFSTPSYHPVRATGRFEQIELRNTGQAFRLGRYTVHWHLHGHTHYGSWMKGCATHTSWNRAVTIHGT